jgi:hypothetical protein
MSIAAPDTDASDNLPDPIEPWIIGTGFSFAAAMSAFRLS